MNLGRWFQRLLYRVYYYAGSVSSFFRERVQPVAWMWLGAFFVSLLLGVNMSQSQVVALSSLILAALLVGAVWAFLRRADVTGERLVNSYGAVGEVFSYSIKVQNLGKKSLEGVRFRELSHDSRPKEWEFLHLREPMEETRNPFDRLFGYYRWTWLNELGGRWETGPSSKVVSLQPGESFVVSLSMIPCQRGILELRQLRVELADPFGFFQRISPVLSEPKEILVIPRRYQLPRLEDIGIDRIGEGDDDVMSLRGEGNEFLGMRDYRSGDAKRAIFWKGWAKTGRAIVKEYEKRRPMRISLVLDSSLEKSDPNLFEQAVSVSASFVEKLGRAVCHLDLVVSQERLVVHRTQEEDGGGACLMKVLAKVEARQHVNYEQLFQFVISQSLEGSGCLVVLSGWCESRKALIKRLREGRENVLVYALGNGPRPKSARNLGVKWLRGEYLQEDLMSVK
jgi:uncharacterized protein (DUF58 family)